MDSWKFNSTLGQFGRQTEQGERTWDWNHSSLDWSPRAAVQRLGFIDRQKNGTFCPHLTF